jgi:O-antigen ligase
MKLFVMKWYNIQPILTALWGGMLCMLLLSRPISTVALIVLGIVVILSQFIKDKPKIIWSRWGVGISLIILFFFVYTLGYFRFIDHPEAWPRFEKKSPLFFIPILWVLSRLRWQDIQTRIYIWLCLSILLAGIIMIAGSTIAFVQTGDWNQFFYHSFTNHIQISAIYYSLFIVTALALPINVADLPISDSTHRIIRSALFGLLLISASKIFIFISIGILLHRWLSARQKIELRWKRMVLLALAGVLTIPVLIRTSSLLDTNLEVITQDQYKYDTRLNGLTLRLIQVRLGLEVLSLENAWVTGVGPAMNKTKLDDRYKAHNMYTGNPELGDKGMLAYNYHNQWVETSVAVGLPGLSVLLLIFGSLIFSVNFRRAEASIVIIFAIFMFTESFLERQQGVVLFAFLTSILFKPDSIE